MPVDFEPSEDTRAVVRGITEFADRHAGPLMERFPGLLVDERAYLEPDGRLKPELVDAAKGLKRASAQAGYYALTMPEDVGGPARPFVDAALAMAALCERGLTLHKEVLAFVEGPSAMLLALDESQRERWLRPLVRAELSTAFAITEPGAGSDLSQVATKAERKGDSYVLNGTKTFITNAPYADFFEVFARTSGGGLGGLSLFLVDRDTPGLEVGRVQQTLLADGMQSDVHLRDVEVGRESLVGKEGDGFELAISNIGLTRVLIGAMCLGLSRFCLSQAVEYARTRNAFGRAIGKHQGIAFPLADAATRIYALENVLLNCAWRLDRGEPCIAESSMVKVYGTETLFEVADAAVQTHGGLGLMRELPIERVFRFARVLRIPEGTSEIQRATIAKTLGL